MAGAAGCAAYQDHPAPIIGIPLPHDEFVAHCVFRLAANSFRSLLFLWHRHRHPARNIFGLFGSCGVVDDEGLAPLTLPRQPGGQHRLLTTSRRVALLTGTIRCRASQSARAQVFRVAPSASRQGRAHRVESCRTCRPRPSSPRHSEPRPRQSVRGDPRSSLVPDHTTHTTGARQGTPHAAVGMSSRLCPSGSWPDRIGAPPSPGTLHSWPRRLILHPQRTTGHR